MTTIAFNIISVADLPDWYFSAVTAFFFLSLGVNALVTAMIVYKIATTYRNIQGISSGNVRGGAHGNGQRDLNPLVSIMIESGLITFVGQLVQSIMYKSANAAFPLVGGCVVMLYVRVSCRLSLWCFNFIYLLHREFRRQLFLCASGWAFPSIMIQQGWIQRIRAPCSLHHSH